MEGCTLTRYRLDPDTAAAFFHDPLDYGQARSGAPTTTFIRRVKKVESFFTDLLHHTHPVIRQEERPVVGSVSIYGITDPDLDVEGYAIPSEFERICNQVHEHIAAWLSKAGCDKTLL